MPNPIPRLTILGQSLWYDNIQRRLLENGELAALIANGDIRGVTSNPTIFNNAIAKSSDYDSALTPLAWAGWDAESIFWQLAVEDIRAAADLFLPLYRESMVKKTKPGDGFVSLEVSPYLANDTEGTIAQAKVLWERVDRPNLMIKIPATKAGIPAVRAVIAAGINVNVTLIFSLKRYAEVMEAYQLGLEDRIAAGLPVDQIASVASFFVSRVDSKIDALLESMTREQPDKAESAAALMGKAAIANAKVAYDAFEMTFTSGRFASIRARYNGRVQRPLWASTGTKNPAYPDTLYVDTLIGPDTVNTVPPQTLDAYRDHGEAQVTLTRNIPLAQKQLAELESLGISMDKVTQELEDEGVKSFADAFSQVLGTIDARRLAALDQIAPLQASVSERIATLERDSAPRLMHEADPSLWKTSDPAGMAEIRNRLGWLKSPQRSSENLPEIKAFAEEVKDIKKILLLGMGGSSLAPEVMSLVFSLTPDPLPKGEGAGSPPPAGEGLGEKEFAILDSTDPTQVSDTARVFPPSESLYIVSSKSGGTAEVNAIFNYFWALSGQDGSRFVAITDPNTALEKQAKELGFRHVFISDPSVGGRFSVLTPFGLVPAALMGIDVDKLLARAAWMAEQCAADVPAARNPGLALGAVMGEAALAGRDKLTIVTDELFAPFGAWAEQLIAESSGKLGKGISVVDGETLVSAEQYHNDRLFVYLRTTDTQDEKLSSLLLAGNPVVTLRVNDAYDLGVEFYRFEVATAIACAVIEVNAFDQPDVQFNKNITKEKITAYSEKGKLEEGTPAWEGEGVRVYAPAAITGASLRDVVSQFLAGAGESDYVAINAYIPRNAWMNDILQKFRADVRAKTHCATTVGFGPRFLHSTGQLHKGGTNNGVFVQITVEPEVTLEIPTQNMTFGVLERAQALGDYEALVSRERRILRVHFPSLSALDALAGLLA